VALLCAWDGAWIEKIGVSGGGGGWLLVGMG
jgi:hypothetical protein